MAKERIFLTTDWLPVHFAAVTTPMKNSYKGEAAKPEYVLVLDPSEDQARMWMAEVKDKIGNVDFKSKKPKLGVSVREEDDKVLIRATTFYKPDIYDTHNQKLDDPKIGKGSIVRANVSLNIYDKGVSLTLHQIQVKELVEWEAGSTKSAFGTEPTGAKKNVFDF